MKKLVAFLKPTQSELFSLMLNAYKGKAIYSKDNFILVKGVAPILLVAHLDTVHKKPVQDICISADSNILISPQGIGGVYALINAYEQYANKPHLLFTCNEEIGGIGAKSFVYLHSLGKLPKSLNKLKFIVEVDRKGRDDTVYYDCCNNAFEEYITDKGYKIAQGTFTDISLIAPELDATLDKILTMIKDAAQKDFPKFEYLSFIDDFVPKSLLDEYVDIYAELLDEYTIEQLEYFRSTYEDKILGELYCDIYDPFNVQRKILMMKNALPCVQQRRVNSLFCR